MPTSFDARLRKLQENRQSVVCVGLDPDLARLPPPLREGRSPAEAVIAFNRAIIEATCEHAAAFKLNLAFYEALGREGWRVLETTLAHIPEETIVILDGKRGDIGNTARRYAEAIFERLGADACTVSPYMGEDALAPFLEYEGKATFVLARTSNPGAAPLQEATVDGEAFYRRVVRLSRSWAKEAPGTLGFVVGATTPHALAQVRALCPEAPLLIPGVGAQGGNPTVVMDMATTGEGLVLVNSSRGILYASEDGDFAEAARAAARSLRDRLSQAG